MFFDKTLSFSNPFKTFVRLMDSYLFNSVCGIRIIFAATAIICISVVLFYETHLASFISSVTAKLFLPEDINMWKGLLIFLVNI